MAIRFQQGMRAGAIENGRDTRGTVKAGVGIDWDTVGRNLLTDHRTSVSLNDGDKPLLARLRRKRPG
jgi:hypothetical protein